MIYTVSVPTAHIFRCPDLKSEHVDEALFGTEVEISDRLGGFARITDEFGYSGWTQ